MSSEEINAVIDNLCEKLGTTAAKLLPEIARMKTAEGIAFIVIVSVLLCAATALTVVVVRWAIREDPDDAVFPIFFVAIPEIILIFLFSFGVCDLAGWISSPAAKALYELVDMVK